MTQPERVRDPAFLEEVAALAPDVAVVVAFGQIFPRALLDLPRHGCVNLHASLLPRWRGASPIQAAVAAGDARTGVATMLMDEGLDTGPILLEEAVEIGPQETAGRARPAARRGRRAAHGAHPARLERGELEPAPAARRRGDLRAAPHPRERPGGLGLAAREIHDRLRAYTPWPGLTAELRGEPVKIAAAEVTGGGEAGEEPRRGRSSGSAAAGCRRGLRRRHRARPRRAAAPGQRALRAADFANGERLRAGESFT